MKVNRLGNVSLLDQGLKSGRIVKYRVIVPGWGSATLCLHGVAVSVSLHVPVGVVDVVARPIHGGHGVVTTSVCVVMVICQVILCFHVLGVGAAITGAGISV